MFSHILTCGTPSTRSGQTSGGQHGSDSRLRCTTAQATGLLLGLWRGQTGGITRRICLTPAGIPPVKLHCSPQLYLVKAKLPSREVPGGVLRRVHAHGCARARRAGHARAGVRAGPGAALPRVLPVPRALRERTCRGTTRSKSTPFFKNLGRTPF